MKRKNIVLLLSCQYYQELSLAPSSHNLHQYQRRLSFFLKKKNLAKQAAFLTIQQMKSHIL
ncbi:MAG: hypothetical protein HN390_02705 [Anaerolineae bacterium]|jgi:hypothetical protein|nr:hypothetical protein [Anaerolineae bacterium]MBT7191229.1 hypothetical protein [Anaerolineae bacterium]MBT7988994.1 hypothetical protein [Anaerolineae bacterium]